MTEEIQDQPEVEDKIKVVNDDAPVNVEKAATSDEITPEEGINHLKKQLEDERRARADADRRANEAQQLAHRAQRDVQDGDYQLIVSAIDKAKSNSELLKNAYAESMAVGDYRKVADIQEALALNANKLSTLENGKSALENRLRQPVQQVSNDPVEEFASRLTPRSANWIRNNPDYARDPKKYESMVRAHNHAMGEGYVPDTDAYFQHVENRLGLRNAAELEMDDDVVSVAAAPVQKRTAAPAAPTTRMASNTSGKPTTVRLTPEQREMASMMGQTPEEYAKNMVALKREGRLN
jgi:cell division septation protein DedD